MSKSERIRQLLAKGLETKEIAKRLKVSANLVSQVKWHEKNKKKPAKKKAGKKENPIEWKPFEQLKKAKEALDTLDPDSPLNWKWVDLPAEAEIPQTDKKIDPVNSPPHYTAGGIETIDFIEAKDLNYRLGNVVKYLSRAGKKVDGDPIADLKKARWYLDREILTREFA
jgi:hypothetical protein